MKIFDRDGKINFVDDNNVFVGFDFQSCCCENFGYLINATPPTNTEESLPDSALDGFQFDPSFIATEGVQLSERDDGGGSVVFKLTKCGEVLYLTLYNHHNGYYGHGFEFGRDGKATESGYL